MRTNLLVADPLTPGTCEWCGNPCELEDVACSLSCEAQLRRLEAAQGQMVVRALKRWRKHRGRKDTPGEGQISQVAQLIDGFLKNDRLRRENAQAKFRAQAAAKQKAAEPVTGQELQSAGPHIDPPQAAD